MPIRKLTVLLCALIACAPSASAQVVWTAPSAHPPGDAVVAGPQAAAAGLLEQAKLLNTAPNTFGLGAAVAIDGETAVVGAPFIAQNGIQRGAVLVYTRASGSWQLQQILQRDTGVGFGYSVDISGDTLIVGRQLNAGADLLDTYVFVRTGGSWAYEATLQPASGASGAVAIDGNTALVASFDDVYVYVRSGSTWAQQGRLFAPDRPLGAPSWRFGSSGPRSIALEGNTAVVGASHAPTGGNAEQGAVYVFTRSGTAWSPRARLTHSAGTALSRLGSDVALSGDIVLASGGGRGAYVFERFGATWGERPPLQIPAASPSCPVCPTVPAVVGGLAIDGSAAVVLGAPGQGGSDRHAAYAFRRVNTSWFFQEQLLASDAQLQTGVAVAGNTVVAGAPHFGSSQSGGVFDVGPGAAYVFTLPDTLPNGPPAPPTLTVSVSGTTAHLSWTPAAGPAAQSYILEAGTATGLSNVFNGNVGSTTQLSAAAPPGTYYVRVRGVNAFGTGAASIERIVTLGAPGPPTVTAAVEDTGILNVAWLPAAGSVATSHRLDFYSGDTIVATVLVGPVTSVALPIPPGTRGTFGVRVTAIDVVASPPSALFPFTVGAPCTPPSSPMLSGGVVGDTASVTWPPVSGATSYVLSAGTSQGGTQYMPPTDLGATTGASASGLPLGFTAWVRVVAVNECGQQSAPADFFVR